MSVRARAGFRGEVPMGLRIKLAETTEEHDGLFRTRHEIFVDEMGYSKPTADGRLIDRFDAFPTTANVIALDGDVVVGGVRFMLIPAMGGPADPYFDFSPYLPASAHVGSGSMLLMKKRFRAVRGATFAMLAMGYQWAINQGITHVVGLAAPDAEPLFFSMGYRPVAERIPFEGAGGTALPVVLDVSRLADPFLEFVR
jgi:N-acyl-L-homoserine lactone synthetase